MQDSNIVQQDEIDLRELFATIAKYKKFIVAMTLFVTVVTVFIAYRMPKYYKTTTTIEVKPKSDDKGFSLGGASALLGLAGMSAPASNTEKEAAQMLMFSTNKEVLKRVSYNAQYWQSDSLRDLPLVESNSSVIVKSYKAFNKKAQSGVFFIKPVSDSKYKLYTYGKFSNKLLGEFNFNKNIKLKDFSINIARKNKGVLPDKITLYENMHYIYENIIAKNLTVDVDKKNPFINISFLDTIPKRGEAYVAELIKQYTKLSIKRELEDLNITLKSINNQIEDIEKQVKTSQQKMESFKTKEKIVDPQAQIEVLLTEKAKITSDLMKSSYQLSLIKQILSSVKSGKNLESVAPSLIDFGDKATTMLIAKLQELQLNEAQLKSQFTPEYPELKSVKAQINSIKRAIFSNLKNLLNATKSKNIALKKLVAEYNKKIESIPKTEVQMSNILRDYKFNEKLYGYLLQKRASILLKMQETQSKFRVIEPIYTDYKAAKPKKTLIVVVAFITALIFSIFIAFFREFLNSTKESSLDRVKNKKV